MCGTHCFSHGRPGGVVYSHLGKYSVKSRHCIVPKPSRCAKCPLNEARPFLRRRPFPLGLGSNPRRKWLNISPPPRRVLMSIFGPTRHAQRPFDRRAATRSRRCSCWSPISTWRRTDFGHIGNRSGATKGCPGLFAWGWQGQASTPYTFANLDNRCRGTLRCILPRDVRTEQLVAN